MFLNANEFERSACEDKTVPFSRDCSDGVSFGKVEFINPKLKCLFKYVRNIFSMSLRNSVAKMMK